MNETGELFDIIVIGGGINGTGITADASGRGLKILLCEQNDLASATSSNSSKLIHGGLRYLEHYEFRLVSKALAEREVLLKNAPHIMRPLTFRLPHQRHLRPSWLIRTGLFLYDHLAKRVTLPSSKSIQFSEDSPLVSSITRGFEYSDGWVDDARLVILNAVAAREHGAVIKTRTQCVNAERLKDHWLVTFKNRDTGKKYQVKSKGIVNAAGPWVASFIIGALKVKSPKNIRLVKGSHIVVPRVHDQPQAYMLQNEDQRIVFVIPFEDDFSLIGTTDVEYEGDLGDLKIDQQEIDYLINITNTYFKKHVTADDIVTTFSGVRPLLDDKSDSAQTVTRDYTLELDSIARKTPLLSVFGGKITTYRKLAEMALDKLSPFYPSMGPKWTHNARLPGGNFDNRASLANALTQKYPWLRKRQLDRYVRSYGTLTYRFLDGVNSEEDLGLHFGADLYETEVRYLVEQEWACDIEDIIWRRTKLGLYLSEKEIGRLAKYLGNRKENKVA